MLAWNMFPPNVRFGFGLDSEALTMLLIPTTVISPSSSLYQHAALAPASGLRECNQTFLLDLYSN
jgi:hypothetical protein